MSGPRTTARPDVTGQAPDPRGSADRPHRCLRLSRCPPMSPDQRHRGRGVRAAVVAQARWVGTRAWQLLRVLAERTARGGRAAPTRVAAFASAARGCHDPGGHRCRRAVDRHLSRQPDQRGRAAGGSPGLILSVALPGDPAAIDAAVASRNANESVTPLVASAAAFLEHRAHRDEIRGEHREHRLGNRVRELGAARLAESDLERAFARAVRVVRRGRAARASPTSRAPSPRLGRAPSSRAGARSRTPRARSAAGAP